MLILFKVRVMIGKWSDVLTGRAVVTAAVDMKSGWFVIIKSRRLFGRPALLRCIGSLHGWVKLKLSSMSFIMDPP